MHNLKVYVAAAGQDIERVRAAQKRLREGGCEITFDWTHSVEQAGGDGNVTKDQAVEAAQLDFEGVRQAHVLLFLTPSQKSRGAGCWFEFGVAVASNKMCVLAGAQRDRSVFCKLTELRFADDDDAIGCVLLFAKHHNGVAVASKVAP